MSYNFLGTDVLTKLKAQIGFTRTGPEVTREIPISMVLALRVEEQYQLHDFSSQAKTPDMKEWMTFPKPWVETGGIGVAV